MMLDIRQQTVAELLMQGGFGLEMEGLRVNGEGYLAHTAHPFGDHASIERDFCENQVEMVTTVCTGPKAVQRELKQLRKTVLSTLKNMPGGREYLWPFSNPPYVKNEEDIPIAYYSGEMAAKTAYREYLANRYGRYKMLFSGIHFNYSFSEELMRILAARSGKETGTFKNEFYLELAEKALAYGWIIVALTAASPLYDSSYIEKGQTGITMFSGIATLRCSELGYWNYFTPILDYGNLKAYTASIQGYIDQGLLAAASELYYPVRLKPEGLNTLERLASRGVDHLEIRMLDLNPLDPCGIALEDIRFLQLFLVWLAGQPRLSLTAEQQVQAIQNYKNAAHFDLKEIKCKLLCGRMCTLYDGLLDVLSRMEEYFSGMPGEYAVEETLAYQREKVENREKRYAWQIRERFSEDYVGLGMALAKEYAGE
ncbi:MAG: hypothetical protein HFI88_10350 [Lachnospiraceae bacterium]|nr:hypothetical protein [Lachnospiraceae bacterium]